MAPNPFSVLNDWRYNLTALGRDSNNSLKFESNLVGGDLQDPFGNSTSRNSYQYTPNEQRNMSAAQMESEDYYKNYGSDFKNQDITDTNSAFHKWAKDYDSLYLNGKLNNSSFFDESGNLRGSWNHLVNGRQITTKDPFEHFQYLRNDGKLGSGHNIRYGKRYYYLDNNNQRVYLDYNNDFDKYQLSDANRNYEDGVIWDDYEVTGFNGLGSQALSDPGLIDLQGGFVKPNANNQQTNDQQKNPTFIGETPSGIKEIEPLNAKKNPFNFLPDVIAGSRLWMALRNNKKVHDIYNESIKPVFRDTYERYSPVTGDYAALSFKNQQAANVLSRASQPYTSDASLNAARQFDAQRQALQLQTEGFLADNQRIRQTSQEALARSEDNMARRSEVANYNRQQLQDVRERKAENDALTEKANWASIDQYAQGWEKRFRYENEKRKQDIDNWNDIIIQQNANKYREVKYRELQNRIAQLEAQYGGTSKIPINIQRQIEQDIKDLDNKYSDYLYQQKAKLEGINYPRLYNKSQRDSWKPTFKIGGKFVPTLQRGGNVANALAVYQDISGPYYDAKLQAELQKQAASSSGKKSSSSSDNKGDFTKKDFINAIKDAKLLPNDVNVFYEQVSNLFSKIRLGGMDSDDMATQYLQIMPLLNNGELNRKQYDEVYTKLNKSGNLSELAYYQGGIYATDSESKKVVHISKQELDKNPDRYNPMTYGQLLWCTTNMPDQAYNHSYLEAANSSISLNEINQMIKDRITQIGTNKTTFDYFGQNNVAYPDLSKNPELQNALQTLQALTVAGPSGYYKISETDEMPSEEILQQAISYIMQTLPSAAKGRLAFETEHGTDQEVSQLVLNMLLGTTNRTTKREVTPISGVSEDGTLSKKGTSNKQEDEKSGFTMAVITDQGDDYRYTLLKDKGSMLVDGKIFTSIPNIDRDMSLKDWLTKSNLEHIVSDKTSISFGDIKLDQHAFLDVLVDSSSNMITATLPKNNDGSVNFNVLDTYLEIQNKLQDEGYKLNSPEYVKKQKELIREAGLQYMYDDQGLPRKEFFGHFMIIEGLASDKTIGINSRNKPSSFKEIESKYTIPYKDNREYQDKLIKGLSSKENGEYKLDDVFNGLNPLDWFMSTDTIYEGNIYIPITESKLKAQWADNNDIKASTAHRYDEEQQIMNKRKSANSDLSFE